MHAGRPCLCRKSRTAACPFSHRQRPCRMIEWRLMRTQARSRIGGFLILSLLLHLLLTYLVTSGIGSRLFPSTPPPTLPAQPNHAPNSLARHLHTHRGMAEER
ncbi:protein of unknown function [Methylacidimicrobium sp. AP8]|nr:protein of unknown function [Methylacidimicrobium sp. AP8]